MSSLFAELIQDQMWLIGQGSTQEVRYHCELPPEGQEDPSAPGLAGLRQAMREDGLQLEVIDHLCWSPESIMSLRTVGATEIRQGVVAPYEIEEVYDHARRIGVPEGFVLHVCERLGYTVDHHLRVLDPLGLRGVRLEGHFHWAALQARDLHNMKMRFEKLGIRVKHLVPKPMVLLQEYGLPFEGNQHLVIDLQRHACQLALGEHGRSRFVAFHPMGEGLLDQDLTQCLGISLGEAVVLRQQLSALLQQGQLRRYWNGVDVALAFEVLSARAQEMVEAVENLVSEHIRWDLPLVIEVVSSAAEPYWRPWLMRKFPQAAVVFHPGALEDSWRGVTALRSYVRHLEKQKLWGQQQGFRAWWKRCRNWIEYHL